MLAFLLDANLSPETAAFLCQQFSFNAQSLLERKQAHLTDSEIVNLAVAENLIIITLDLDFGELYHQKEAGKFGVIILRLRDQRVERVNAMLEQFLAIQQGDKLFTNNPNALVVITETAIRILY